MARKMLSFYVLQFGALLALNFQLYGLIMSYKMFAHRNNMILASFLSSRQSKLQRKRKHALARQLRRKARSVWFQKGRTDQWWQNMLGENATDGNRKKNFCMIRDGFYDIAALLDPFTASKHGSPNYHLLLSEKKPAIPLYNLRIPGRFG